MFTEKCIIEIPIAYKGNQTSLDEHKKYIIDTLEYIGYKRTGKYSDDINYKFIYISTGKYRLSINKPEIKEGIHDCKTNVDLFIALASLNNKHDNHQWFICHTPSGPLWERFANGPDRYAMLNGNKATVKDLYDHFNHLDDTIFGNDPYSGIGIKREGDFYAMAARDTGVEITANGKLVCYIEINQGKPEIKIY